MLRIVVTLKCHILYLTKTESKRGSENCPQKTQPLNLVCQLSMRGLQQANLSMVHMIVTQNRHPRMKVD